MTEDDPKITRLKTALAAAAPSLKRPRTPRAALSIQGDGNIVGDGNQIIHAPVVRVRRTITPPPGSVTPAQKRKLKEVLFAWIEAHNTVRVRSKPLTPGAAWSRFYKAFDLTSYAELPAARFAEALSWLQQRYAEIANMKSAARKLPNWRASRIRSIKARCKNQLGDERAYLDYIQRRFNASSLTQLSDDELQVTYAYIMGKKPGI